MARSRDHRMVYGIMELPPRVLAGLRASIY
jgi:hypothetical protein